jgi:hypothetical protein
VAVQVAHLAAFADWIPECVDPVGPAVADSIVSVGQAVDYVDFAALVVD